MSSTSQLDKAYLYIRQQIEGGMIRPGQRLSRRKLAEEIGVSSALVQQALAQLDREGITESRPRSGTYVRELSETELGKLFDIRELLEPYAAANAAERITEEEIEVLRESCQRYQRLKTQNAWDGHAATAWLHRCQTIREELIFHGTIIRASGNQFLTDLISTLRLLGQISPGLVYEGDEVHENSPLVIAYEHEGIVDAIAARDPDLAHERMLNHIRGARMFIRQSKPQDAQSVNQRAIDSY